MIFIITFITSSILISIGYRIGCRHSEFRQKIKHERRRPQRNGAILAIRRRAFSDGVQWARKMKRFECQHLRVTVTEDGGRCNDCGNELDYSPKTHNWGRY